MPTDNTVDVPQHRDALAALTDFQRDRQFRLIRKFSELLRPALRAGEEVLFGSPASRPLSLVDIYYQGMLAGHYGRYVLMFTTERLFVFPTRGDFFPRASISFIEYGDLDRIEVSGFISKNKITLRTRRGMRERFKLHYEDIGPRVAAEIPDRVRVGRPTERGERAFLCPKCHSIIGRESFECSRCGTRFKSRAEALRRSMLIPGGGYFYTGEYFYGIADAIVEATLLLYMLIVIVDVAANGLDAKGVAALVGGTILIAFEKAMSVRHALAAVETYMVDE